MSRRRPAVALASAAVALTGWWASAPLSASGGATTPTTAPSSSTGVDADQADQDDQADQADQNDLDGLYADPAHWLCRGDVGGDPCDAALDVTTIAADGTLAVAPFQPVGDEAVVDCFYIYPTISTDAGANSDLTPSAGEEGYAALTQATLLGEACRVFAPVYRQTTLTALASGQWSAESQDVAFADVAAAFGYYLDHFNEGRGVVLLGHSQGAGLGLRLLQDVVEADPAVHRLLVSAFLAGTTVAVPEGADVGGDLASTPLCSADDQYGCVVSWSTYRAEPPPAASAIFGADPGAGTVAACTNPAALGGGPAELDARFPAAPDLSILSNLGADATSATGASTWLDPSAGAITTPFVAVPGLITGECSATGTHHALLVQAHADPGPRADDFGGDLTPEWGLHLVDVNIVLGDLIRLVRSQSAAWADAR